MPVIWNLSRVFLMIRLGLLVFRRKTIEVKYSYHVVIKVTYFQYDFTVDINLDHLVEVMLFFPPSFYTLSFGRESLCTITLKDGYTLEGKVST